MMLKLAQETYFDFNMVHSLEMLKERHGLDRWCRAAGIAKCKRQCARKARVHRERMASDGLLLQIDGSHHKWNGGPMAPHCDD